MEKSTMIRLVSMFLLLFVIVCSGAAAETTREGDTMIDYDFTVFTHVKITGIDLDPLTKEELGLL